MSTQTFQNRIPKDFFVAKGRGESDITIHAGSYHLALRQAKIEMCNILTYSSILPKIAREIRRPKNLVHGSVMETINAVAHCEMGQSATAGIIWGWLYDKKTGEKYGGLVCEYNGGLFETEKVAVHLREMLNELYTNGYDDKFSLRDIKIVQQTVRPKKRFGTAIVSLCFVNYEFPIG